MQFPYTIISEEKQHVKSGEILHWMTQLKSTAMLALSLL